MRLNWKTMLMNPPDRETRRAERLRRWALVLLGMLAGGAMLTLIPGAGWVGAGWGAVGFVALYALWNAPSRHRRHGLMEIKYQGPSAFSGAGEKGADAVPPPPRRNDPCPCGSESKYKRCCGRDRVA